MISETEIEEALGTRLTALNPLPLIGWENRPPQGTNGIVYDVVPESLKPYLLVEVAPFNRGNPLLKGGATGTMSEGYLQVMAVAQVDTWGTAGKALIDRVLALFPAGWKSPLTTTGTVEATGIVRPVPSYNDGANWRVGTRIYYKART